MGEIRPPAPKAGNDFIIRGNKSLLKNEETRFIDFQERIKTDDLYSFLFKPSKSTSYNYEPITGTNKIKVGDDILEKIDYEIISNPLSTGSQTKTFWKTQDNIYFFKIAGGFGTDHLFGPFRLKGGKFVFEITLKEDGAR